MSEMTTVQVLERALGRLGPNGENWVRFSSAQPTAMCAYGAVCRTVGERVEQDAAADALRAVVPNGYVGVWNDSRSDFSEVRAAFQKAIAAEKRKAGTYIEVPEPQPAEVPA